MTAEPVHPDLVRIALDKVEGTEFERFVNAFYPAISGSSFVPWAGQGRRRRRLRRRPRRTDAG
jgi:hypothetical protein